MCINPAHWVPVVYMQVLSTIFCMCINPFRLSFSELKCARGGHIIFLESIFQHSPHEIVIYNINRKSYNKKVNILWKLNKCATDSSVIYE